MRGPSGKDSEPEQRRSTNVQIDDPVQVVRGQWLKGISMLKSDLMGFSVYEAPEKIHEVAE